MAEDYSQKGNAQVGVQEMTRGTLANVPYRVEKRMEARKELQQKFQWWPTDAKPGMVRDEERGGYWWWPTTPGEMRPWGNRGYIYVHKVIFDYKVDELPPAKQEELRPSLLVRRILKNVKVYFDYDSELLRDDAKEILDSGVRTLRKNDEASIMVTGNADTRGPEAYNVKLAKKRAESVRDYLVEKGVASDRILVISRGKLDAVAPITDLVGMQKERNAQFVVAEVEEVMLPYQGPPQGIDAAKVDDSTYVVQEKTTVESEVQVTTLDYVIRDGDTLSEIAKEQLGSSHRWEFLYEFNKDRIKDPHKLKPGQKILIPVE